MSQPEIRPLVPEDRDAIQRLLAGVELFSAEEAATALELVDEWIATGEASGYLTYVLDDNGVTGFVSFGPTPLTQSTWDLYWIAVAPEAQGHGYGRRLLRFAEAEVRQRGGTLLLIETGSREANAATVRFYQKAGYQLTCRIADFYRPGDDKLTFGKQLPPDEPGPPL